MYLPSPFTALCIYCIQCFAIEFKRRVSEVIFCYNTTTEYSVLLRFILLGFPGFCAMQMLLLPQYISSGETYLKWNKLIENVGFIVVIKWQQVSLGGLGVTCLPRDPRFAGSNPAEIDGYFQDVKILSTSLPGET